MSESRLVAISLDVRLKPFDTSVHPRAVNYINVGVVQGITHLDCGFIEPALLAAIAKTAKEGQSAPKGLDGHLVTRVVMRVDVLARQGNRTAYVSCDAMKGQRNDLGEERVF